MVIQPGFFHSKGYGLKKVASLFGTVKTNKQPIFPAKTLRSRLSKKNSNGRQFNKKWFRTCIDYLTESKRHPIMNNQSVLKTTLTGSLAALLGIFFVSQILDSSKCLGCLAVKQCYCDDFFDWNCLLLIWKIIWPGLMTFSIKARLAWLIFSLLAGLLFGDHVFLSPCFQKSRSSTFWLPGRKPPSIG